MYEDYLKRKKEEYEKILPILGRVDFEVPSGENLRKLFQLDEWNSFVGYMYTKKDSVREDIEFWVSFYEVITELAERIPTQNSNYLNVVVSIQIISMLTFINDPEYILENGLY